MKSLFEKKEAMKKQRSFLLFPLTVETFAQVTPPPVSEWERSFAANVLNALKNVKEGQSSAPPSAGTSTSVSSTPGRRRARRAEADVCCIPHSL